jgi:hypothetical protein
LHRWEGLGRVLGLKGKRHKADGLGLLGEKARWSEKAVWMDEV